MIARLIAIFITVFIVVAIYSILPATPKKWSADMKQLLYDNGSIEDLVKWRHEIDMSQFNFPDDYPNDYAFSMGRETWPPFVKDLNPSYVYFRRKPKLITIEFGGGLSNDHGIVLCDNIGDVHIVYDNKEDYFLEVNQNVVIWYDLHTK